MAPNKTITHGSAIRLGKPSVVDMESVVGTGFVSLSGMDLVAPPTTRFVVYNIEQNMEGNGVTNTLFLAEV